MAKRRCIAIDVYQNDAFLNLSDKAKVLYTAFILNSDDDGFIINPKTVMRLYEAQQNVLDELVENGYILTIDNLFVIKHWKVHNKLQNNRHTATSFQSTLSKLHENEQEEYEITDSMSKVDQKLTENNANITKLNITKDNIIKDNINKSNENEQRGIVKDVEDDDLKWAVNYQKQLNERKKGIM